MFSWWSATRNAAAVVVDSYLRRYRGQHGGDGLRSNRRVLKATEMRAIEFVDRPLFEGSGAGRETGFCVSLKCLFYTLYLPGW